MEVDGIVSSQPLTHGSASHARFSLDRFDESAGKRENQLSKGSNQQASEYQLGNLDALLEKAQLTKSKYKNGLNLTVFSDLSSFSVFGPSIYLYFQFLRKLTIIFAFLSIISLVPIAYNAIEGTAYSSSAYGVTAALARTSLGAHASRESEKSSAKIVNVVVVALNIFILVVFWLYWKKFTLEESDRIERELELSNYGAVVVEMDDNQFDEHQLTAFLAKFGSVQEVQKVVDLKNALYYAQEIVSLSRTNQLLEFIQRREAGRREQLNNKISQNQHRIESLKPQLLQQLKLIRSSEEVVLRYFVKFDSHEALQRILGTFSEYEGCCGKRVPEELLINNKKISVARQQCQPYEIYWENQSVSWRESCLPHVLMLVAVNLFVIACLIAIGLLLASARPVYYQSSLPSNSFNFSAISSTDQASIDSWCLGSQPVPESKQLCLPVYELYSVRIVISIAIGMLLMAAKLIVKQVILFSRPFLRFHDKVEESKEIIMHLFINYSVITVIITLSLQTNLFTSAIVNIFISCVQDPQMRQHLASLLQYYDYNSQWYLEYGFQLFLNFFMMAVLPHCFAPLLEVIIHRIKTYRASQLKYEVLMSEKLEVTTFELEDHYASMLCVLLAGLVFAGGMPLMIPLVFITLLAKLFATKYLFLHLNQPPLITERTLANKIPPVFLFIITAYLLNSTWAFGVETVFAPESTLFNDRGINAESNAHNPFEALLVFLKRLASTWQPAMVYLLGVIAIIMRKLLLKVYSNYILQNANAEKHPSVEAEGQGRAQDHLSPQQASGARSSYRKQVSSDYAEVLHYINSISH